jgi:hypothetical protein
MLKYGVRLVIYTVSDVFVQNLFFKPSNKIYLEVSIITLGSSCEKYPQETNYASTPVM